MNLSEKCSASGSHRRSVTNQKWPPKGLYSQYVHICFFYSATLWLQTVGEGQVYIQGQEVRGGGGRDTGEGGKTKVEAGGQLRGE